MLRNTRQEILDTAKKLFNEQGFNDVSTRDISEILGISKGNLTYHFKKKEDIIEALLTEQPNTQPTSPPKNLLELDAFFEDIQSVVQENAFYFWHHAQLGQISSKIRELQQIVFQKNVELLTLAFAQLLSDGLLRKESYTGEYGRLIEALLLVGIYWIPFCKLKASGTQHEYAKQAWSILLPVLTDEGKKQLSAITSMSDAFDLV